MVSTRSGNMTETPIVGSGVDSNSTYTTPPFSSEGTSGIKGADADEHQLRQGDGADLQRDLGDRDASLDPTLDVTTRSQQQDGEGQEVPPEPNKVTDADQDRKTSRSKSTSSRREKKRKTLAKARYEAARAKLEYLEACEEDSSDVDEDSVGTDLISIHRTKNWVERSQREALALTMLPHNASPSVHEPLRVPATEEEQLIAPDDGVNVTTTAADQNRYNFVNPMNREGPPMYVTTTQVDRPITTTGPITQRSEPTTSPVRRSNTGARLESQSMPDRTPYSTNQLQSRGPLPPHRAPPPHDEPLQTAGQRQQRPATTARPASQLYSTVAPQESQFPADREHRSTQQHQYGREPPTNTARLHGNEHGIVPSHPRQLDLADLAAAIAQAARAGHTNAPPRYISELPFFNGSAGDWLPYRAAYLESAQYFSDIENTARVRRSLRGTAKEAVSCLFLGNTSPNEVMRRLEARFGRPEALVMTELEKLKSLPRLSDNPREICIFAGKVANIVATVRALGRVHYLYNPEMVMHIEEKLSALLKYRWYDFAALAEEHEPGLQKISRFLDLEAERNGPHAKAEQIKDEKREGGPPPAKRAHRAFTTGEVQKEDKITCEVCEKDGHRATECHPFKLASTDERWELAKKHRLCFRCLRRRTWKHKCKNVQCNITGCTHYHHRMLHHNRPAGEQHTKAVHQAVVTSTWAPKTTRAYLKVLPVKVAGPLGEVDTFALLDDGSTVTLMIGEVASRIGADGPHEPFYIEAVAGARVSAMESRRISFSIRGKHSDRTMHATARTIDKLDISGQTVTHDTLTGCSHLDDITDQLEYHDGVPAILIGQDNWPLLMSTAVRSGSRDQPAASLTPLGWVLHGIRSCATNVKQFHRVNHVSVTDDRLEVMLKEHFALEALGVQPRRPRADPEERAMKILEETTKPLPGGGYETGLLWKENEVTFPSNYDSTLRRLEGVERKLEKNPELKERYREQIESMLQKGYAEVATSEPQSGRTWYLPHFAVLNPAKPNKVRIVHDAAAKTRGVSLNDLLLTGPDLLQSLPGVLWRFRQRPVAVAADIRDMFLRISIRPDDRDALRFLWREDKAEQPTQLRMKSVIFGATSSPCTAIYVKNRNAEAHRDSYPAAADAIVRHHYMDDYLQSFTTTAEARDTVAQVIQVHREAKFELHKWTSNDPAAIIDTVDASTGKGEVALSDGGTTEKILGLIWRPTKDTLGFNLNLAKVDPLLINGERNPTKRELLRTAMSLYDPLGLATPVTIQAKHILQETWRTGLGWDEQLPEDLERAWNTWVMNLRHLGDLELPRCYPLYYKTHNIELHTFVDASETAYAASVYWRCCQDDGAVEITLAAAKGRVAPLKVTSIPRLELQAALLGSRLATAVAEEHDAQPIKRVFWTDSRTVLAWLRAGPRAFKPFVAHRVAEIEELTRVNEWRWIPTKHNVADDATRDTPPDFDATHRWYTGPAFLRLHDDTWPQEPEYNVPSTGEEKVTATTNTRSPQLIEALPDVRRFSSWMRLICTTARVLQFVSKCRRLTISTIRKRTQKNAEHDPTWVRTEQERPTMPRERSPIQSPTARRYIPHDATHLLAAETLWLRALQQQSFSEEMQCVSSGEPLTRDSRLRQLALLIDEHGMLRLKSRIAAAHDISDAQKQPIILDADHPYARLYFDWIHRRLHHGGVEMVVNEVRQRFWAVRIRPGVRGVVRRCQRCRIRRAMPPEPPTGNHPEGRLAHHQRPFTYTGLDYFGPLSVTVGRHHQRRYVALFTCLTTRAVHLEMTVSLSTDSAILALRRMMARRGCPTELWSDNGTNLRGADAELRRAALAATQAEATLHTIRWRFIPPGAPFMGGAWERLVRTVKTALAATLHERHPQEEVLTTLLAEVEHTVNSRPLSHVSTSPDDEMTLTPNHFLLGGPSRVPVPGEFTEKDTIGRTHWRAAQHLANQFWARWTREVLPLLQYRREPRGHGDALRVGDLVLIVDNNLPRNVWPRGIVERVFPGGDGVVRAADVRTRGGLLRRPTKKLVILPVDQTTSLPQ